MSKDKKKSPCSIICRDTQEIVKRLRSTLISDHDAWVIRHESPFPIHLAFTQDTPMGQFEIRSTPRCGSCLFAGRDDLRLTCGNTLIPLGLVQRRKLAKAVRMFVVRAAARNARMAIRE